MRVGVHESLHNLVKARKHDALKRLLDQGACVNARNRIRQTPLRVAFSCMNYDAAVILRTYGGDLEVEEDVSYWDPSVFHTLVENERRTGQDWHTLVQPMVERKADLEVTNVMGQTALHLACRNPEGRIAVALAQAKADIAARDEEQRTPLHVAAQHGAPPCVLEALLDLGAGLDALDSRGNTPLMLVCARSLSIRLANWNWAEEQRQVQKEWILALLARKANVENKNRKGQTVIHLASQHNHLHWSFAHLLEGKVDINARDEQGRTALLEAVSTSFSNIRNADAALKLLRLGANPNIASRAGEYPLVRATEHGCVALVEKLLSQGANVHARHRGAETALRVACETRNFRAVECLLQAGADPHELCENGKIPLHVFCASLRHHAPSLRQRIINHRLRLEPDTSYREALSIVRELEKYKAARR